MVEDISCPRETIWNNLKVKKIKSVCSTIAHHQLHCRISGNSVKLTVQ